MNFLKITKDTLIHPICYCSKCKENGDIPLVDALNEVYEGLTPSTIANIMDYIHTRKTDNSTNLSEIDMDIMARLSMFGIVVSLLFKDTIFTDVKEPSAKPTYN